MSRGRSGVTSATRLRAFILQSFESLATTAITLLNAAHTQSALQTFENSVSFEGVGRPTQKLIGTVDGTNRMSASAAKLDL